MLLLLMLALSDPAVASAGAQSDWPNWRGPGQDGVAVAADYPTEWGDEPLWTQPLPGRGSSTPVVARFDGGEPQLLLTVSLDDPNSGDGNEGTASNGVVSYALDGTANWQTPISPLVAGKHKKASGANPSIAVGEKLLFAYFKSGMLAALHPDGRIAWTKDLAREFGGYDAESLWWDLGTSPVVQGENVIVAMMQSGPSFLVALDQATGDVTWRTDRDTDAPLEAAQSYTTPVVGTYDGRDALFTAGADIVTCHDADNGRELWRIGGLNPEGDKYFRSIASPVLLGTADDNRDMLLVPYARGESVWAIAVPRNVGDPPREAAWVRNDLGSDVPTPTGSGGVAYILTDKGKQRGTLHAVDVATGQTLGTHTLPRGRDGYSASPVLAGDRLYLIREDGAGFVVDVSDPASMETVSENQVEGLVVATPVLADGRLFLRTAETLYAFGSE